MDENRNKHYGFVEKSNRFQSQPKTALDDKERGVLRGIEENLRPIVKKNDDVKSKKVMNSFKKIGKRLEGNVLKNYQNS